MAKTYIYAEFGCDAGLCLRFLVVPAAKWVACFDGSAPTGTRSSERLKVLPATVRQVASGQVRLPHESYDVMLLGNVLDHVRNHAQVIAALAALLRPGGRMLVVTRPPAISHPLFAAAQELFARRQLDPARITEAMRAAGLWPAESTVRAILEPDGLPAPSAVTAATGRGDAP
jgi:SAM-dependent methyltransferase